MKKKVFAVMLAAAMVLSLAACGGGDSEKKDDKKAKSESTEKEDTAKDEESEEPAQQEAVTGPFETELEPGAYFVGLHIPEGVYNITVVSGLGSMLTKSGINSAMGSGSAVKYADSYDNATLANGDILTLTQTLKVKITTQEAYFSSMTSYENRAKEEKELSPGDYVIGQDVPAGIYDMSIVSGTANAKLDDYSFTAMLTDNAALAESSSTTFKNLELLEGRTLQISSGTVKLTPAPNITPIAP